MRGPITLVTAATFGQGGKPLCGKEGGGGKTARRVKLKERGGVASTRYIFIASEVRWGGPEGGRRVTSEAMVCTEKRWMREGSHQEKKLGGGRQSVRSPQRD